MKNPRKLEAYLEEYLERIAIKMENGALELVATNQARQEVLAYAKKDGADIEKLMDLIRKERKGLSLGNLEVIASKSDEKLTNNWGEK